MYLKGVNTAALLAENKALKEQCSLHQEQAKYALENLKLRTRQIEEQSQQIVVLKDQIAQLQRMIFGSKSERFVYEDNQLSLFGNNQEELESEVPLFEQRTIATHTRKINKNHPGRSKEAPTAILEFYKGKLQSDGYHVYETINNQSEDIDLSNCNAHARRKFEKALSNDKKSASKEMLLYQKIYAIESRINEKRNDFDTPELFYAYRTEERQVMKDVIEELRDFIHNPPATILPKSLLGKAIMYTRKRWIRLTKFVNDGELEMDTNFIENRIRPLALGRKNYLFAGNHQAATNIGVFYSVFNTCRHLQINVMEYTIWYLERIGNTKINQIASLSPMAYKKLLP